MYSDSDILALIKILTILEIKIKYSNNDAFTEYIVIYSLFHKMIFKFTCTIALIFKCITLKKRKRKEILT